MNATQADRLLGQRPGKPLLALSGELPDPRVAAESSGVGLIRAEYLVRASGAYWTTQACRSHVTGYVNRVLEVMRPLPVWYRLSDLESRDINLLDGCDLEQHDDNPILGPRGLRRARLATGAVRQELAAVVELHARHPHLGLLLPFCRDAADVGYGIQLARTAGYHGAIGAMIEVPAALLEAEQIFGLDLTYCLVGLNDLTGLLLGTSRTAVDFDQAHPTLVSCIRTLLRLASEAGIAVAIGGNYGTRVLNAFEDLPATKFVAHYSDWSSLVDPNMNEYRDMNLVRDLRRASDAKLVAAGLMDSRHAVVISGIRQTLGA